MTNFDHIARAYRWLEYMSFGPLLACCRNAQLSHLTGARHALLLGDGDGRFLAQLLAVNPVLTADVVDSSQTMLNLLARRCGPQARRRIRPHCADALQWKPAGSYDLIVSHFFLDCFFPQQLEQLLSSLTPHVLPGAQWVISEFAIPPHAITGYFARGIIGFLYRSFGLLTGLPVRTLPDYASCLRRYGLAPVYERRFLAGLLCSQVWMKRPAAKML